MAYNIFEYASDTADTTNRNPHYRSIINNINPDILLGIEIEPRDDDKWAVGFLDKVLNGGSSNGAYSMGTYVAITNSGAKNDNNVIYYKHSKFTFLSSQIVVQDGNHPTLEYKLRHNNTFEEIIIYGVHFSSTNPNQRNDEAIDIRAVTDNFTTENFIAAGDFNFNNGSEAAYFTLLDQTNSGYFIDPESFTLAFNTFTLKFSQSSFDERYDLILNSQSVADVGGIEYVSGSFVVDGNDGFGDLNNVPGEYIAASDHLPVYADYLFGNPVPVELAFFTGSLNGNDIELRWKTETEVNNYGFYIERASENSDWSTIGFVEGYGNSNSPKHYNYSDVDIYQSANYSYRLRQTDNDGTYEFSKIVEVEIAPTKFALYQNYPNPFNPTTKIKYTVAPHTSGKVNVGTSFMKFLVVIKVYDVLGNEVAILVNEEKLAGTYEIDFNANNLASGIYVYRMRAGSFVQIRKMLRIK